MAIFNSYVSLPEGRMVFTKPHDIITAPISYSEIQHVDPQELGLRHFGLPARDAIIIPPHCEQERPDKGHHGKMRRC